MKKLVARAVAAVVLLCAQALPANATPPFSFATAPGRLPKTVVPQDYTIAVTPDAAGKTFEGKETIALQMRAAVTKITFNSLNEKLRNVKLDGVAVANVDTSDEKQLTTLTLARPAARGRHTLSLDYTGAIETAPQGLFAQPYKAADGKQGMMLSTQFEATDARRMFPGWDEPAFRATYQLTVTVPASWAAVSNMPVQSRVEHGVLATTTFRRTPKMPSYLLEFSGGDLTRVSAKNGATEHGVWALRGQDAAATYALANSQQILADYNDYFGVPYPLPKLDHIAVPGGFQGAMENWGAITYNDQTLLYPADSTLGRKQTVFSIMAHEMAHQWNGDLVTMGWWDQIWLNESFASWMAAKETALRNPTWNWAEHNDEAKETAMNADARMTSHAIEQHVTNELQAGASFDSAITYDKGEAFLRMLEAYVGPDTFRSGIRAYMKKLQFGNAMSGDLWNALNAASGKNVGAFSSMWTEQPGFPLVSVASACDASGVRTLTFTQKRFLLSGTPTGREHWDVPLNIRSGPADAPKVVTFTHDGQQASGGRCGQPLTVNAGDVGFYRVAYDAQTLALNQQNFGSFTEFDKLPQLDDQWALAESGQADLASYLGFANAMGSSTDARAWGQIAGALTTIEFDERGTAGHDAFSAYARGVLQPLFAQLGWDARSGDLPSTLDLRRQMIGALANFNDPAVIAEARTRYARFMADHTTLSPDNQGVVLGIVAANADQATFDQLHALAKSSKNEAEVRRYYGALSGARDPKLAQQVLDIALSPEIPPQAAAVRNRLVFGVAGSNPALSWHFYQAHHQELLKSISQFEQTLALAGVPAAFWNAAPLSEVEAWTRAHVPAGAGTYVDRGMERARFSLALKERLVPEADAYVASHHT